MLMNVAELVRDAGIYPELAGSRVLIAGVGPTCGIDVARVFAEHGCRLILQIPNPGPETDALLAIVAETALDVQVHHEAIDEASDALQFAQEAAKTYGGLDVVVNLISFELSALEGISSVEDIENLVVARLQAAAQATQVAANRMGLTWTNGSVLNVLRMPVPSSSAEVALGGIARTVLAAMTRKEAGMWAAQGIRINAIAPRLDLKYEASLYDDFVTSEPEIAAAALYLASHDGEELTGYVLDCDTMAACR